MKCVMSGPNAGILAKVIHSFAKIGAELFLNATTEGLLLRTLNMTQCGYAVIKFYPSFFNEYSCKGTAGNELENSCKLSMRACIQIFRNMKQVEICEMTLDVPRSKLYVQLKCRLDTIKTHSISILEMESLQAIYVTENAPNYISASYKILQEISNNFQMNEEEITLEVYKNNLVVKNYVEGSNVDRRFMRSQLNLKAEEFVKYLITEETSLTFCLREFRALLTFSESLNLDISISFQTAGSPVVFAVKSLLAFEATLVMSTLSPEDVSMYQENEPPQERTTSENIIDSFKRNNNGKNGSEENKSKKQKTGTESEKSGNQSESLQALRNNTTSTGPENDLISYTVCNKQTTNLTTTETGSSVSNGLMQKKSNSNFIESEGICVIFKDTDEIYVDGVNELTVLTSLEIEKLRKARMIFRRCFEETLNPSDVPGCSQILARDSDPEDS